MSLTLGDILTAARDRHPLFHKSRVPDAVGARYLTGYQRRMLSRVAEINAELVAQQASILFDLAPDNAVGTVGAGTAGGLPADSQAGVPQEVQSPAGAALEMDFDDAVILVSQFVVGAVTTDTLTKTGASWTVDQYTGRYAWISGGPGIGQGRLILSNTADTLTLQGAWTSIPTAGVSLAEIVVTNPELASDLGAIVQVPAIAERTGYLVRLDSAGIAYLDLTKPLVARYEVGIDLPPHEYLMGGNVHFGDREGTRDLVLGRYAQRWADGLNGYAAYLMGGKLFLVGTRGDWNGVTSIDLRYVPIAPAFTRLTDYFLLPDTAYDLLVARTAETFGYRVNALPGADGAVDTGALDAEAQEAESNFLESVGRTARAFPSYFRSVW